jgi:LuxR family transcriptional regulator, maltose regulon positive regulatory protein
MAPARTRETLRLSLPRHAVPRPPLQHRLDRVGARGVGLLVAPAGSGKSVLLRQWAVDHPDARIVYLELESRHNDAVVLANDLVQALRAEAPDVDPAIADLVMTGGSALGGVFVDQLLDTLAGLPEPTVLVIEDLHVLTNRAVTDDLGDVVTRLPRTTRCAISSRTDPPWMLRQLRLDGRLVEIRATDLAFGATEARDLLLAVSERDLTDENVQAIVARTDGWAVGMQLAGLSLRSAPDLGKAVDSFAGSDRLVAEYLIGEVLDEQEVDLRRFLLSTSVLDWLSADLCRAVTGRDDARELLGEIESRGLFLLPVDGSGTVFRYHRLFAELLQYQLDLEAPDAARTAHLRAARWLAEHGHVGESVGHLLAAGQITQAYATISTIGHRFFERGESATLVTWLTAMAAAFPWPPADLEVNLLAAQLAADQSDPATETHRRLVRRADLTRGERAAADALHTAHVFRGLAPERVLETVDGVLTAVPILDEADVVDFLGLGGLESIRVMAEYDGAVARFLQGDVVGAEVGLEHVLTLPGIDYPIWRIYALSSLALVRAWTGRCNDAIQLADAALLAARALGVAQHTSTVHAHLASALVNLDRAELGPAQHSLGESDLLNRRRPSTVVNADLHRALRARFVAVTEGPEKALAHLRKPAASAIEPTVVAEANRALEARLLIGTRDLVGARVILTEAGVRPGLAAARVDLALAMGDLSAARQQVESWSPAEHELRARVGRHLRQAVLLDLDGDPRAARAALHEAVATSENNKLRWPFLEMPSALRRIRRQPASHSLLVTPALEHLALVLEPREKAQEGLASPLSQRELVVLEYLPGRLRNEDIAHEMFVSVNTLKTHLRNIYGKLGVENREQAISRATDLGLL